MFDPRDLSSLTVRHDVSLIRMYLAARFELRPQEASPEKSATHYQVVESLQGSTRPISADVLLERIETLQQLGALVVHKPHLANEAQKSPGICLADRDRFTSFPAHQLAEQLGFRYGASICEEDRRYYRLTYNGSGLGCQSVAELLRRHRFALYQLITQPEARQAVRQHLGIDKPEEPPAAPPEVQLDLASIRAKLSLIDSRSANTLLRVDNKLANLQSRAVGQFQEFVKELDQFRQSTREDMDAIRNQLIAITNLLAGGDPTSPPKP